MRIASAASNSTCDNESAWSGSRASAHGSVLAMYVLAASTRRKIAATASASANPSIAWVYSADRAGRRGGERPRARGGPDAQAAVPLGHGDQAAHQVAEVVREVDVIAVLVAFPAEVAVGPEGDLLHQVQPQRIRAEALDHFERIDGRSPATCSSSRP